LYKWDETKIKTFQALYTLKRKGARLHLTSSSFGTKKPLGPGTASALSKDDDTVFLPECQIQTRRHSILEKCLEHCGLHDGTSLILGVLG
jgi:hypothetical protein